MYSEKEVDTRARRDMDFLLSALQVVKGQIAMAELGQREAALEAELGPCFDAAPTQEDRRQVPEVLNRRIP